MNIRDSYIHGTDGKGVVKSMYFATTAESVLNLSGTSYNTAAGKDLVFLLADGVGTKIGLPIPTLNQNTTGSAGSLLTVKSTSANNHYLTFVDSNNTTAAAESFYTSGDIYFKPSTGVLTVKSVTVNTTFNYAGIGSDTTSNAARKIWFASSSDGTPVVSDNFKYNPSTKTLTVDKISGPTIVIGNTTLYLDGANNVLTPDTVISNTSTDNTIPSSKAVWDAILTGMQANDAMVFKGFLTGGADVDHTTYTPGANKGDTYKVQTAGYINGEYYQVNDTFICTEDGTVAATSSNVNTVKANWGVVEGNGDYLSIHGGTMYGILKWNNTTALPAQSSPTNFLVVDSFTDTNGAITKYATVQNVRDTLGASQFIGTCTTAAGTAAKVATVEGLQAFKLQKGTIVSIKFSNTNTFSATADNKITLNVNNTGAKQIWYNTSGANTGTNTNCYGVANRYSTYIYDGTYWVWISKGTDDNTTYSAGTAALIQAGTDTANRVWQAKILQDEFVSKRGDTMTGALTINGLNAGLLAANSDYDTVADGIWHSGTDGNSNTISNTPTNRSQVLFKFTPYSNGTSDIRTAYFVLDADGKAFLRGSRAANSPWYTIAHTGNISLSADPISIGWNTSTTIATIAGVNINVKIPANPNIWVANAVGVAGYVAAPTAANNKNHVWMTNTSGEPAWRALAPSISTGTNDTNNIKITVGGVDSDEYTVPFATNAHTTDGYHAADMYNAATYNISNHSSTNDWLQIAKITIPGTTLSIAGFSLLFSNRECLDNTSFILTLSIRRDNTTSAAGVTFYYTPIQGADPRQLLIRSNDNQTFYVYFKSALNTYTTFYKVTKLATEGNIDFTLVGLPESSLISGSLTNKTATRGGKVALAHSLVSEQIYNSAQTLTVSNWTTIKDISGYNAGTYAISIYTTDMYASGVFSACKGTDIMGDEIVLHVSNKTSGTSWRPYARVSGKNLQLSCNEATGTSREYTIKIIKLI